jgi:hypothetical protein
MKTITLAYDYTRNGEIVWPKDVAHEATPELEQLLADGVACTASDDAAAPEVPSAEPTPEA